MVLTVGLVAFAGAVMVRRSTWVRDRLPPPASTLLMALAALVSVLVLVDLESSVGRAVIAGIATLVVGVALVLVVGWATEAIGQRVRRRRQERQTPTLRERVVARADAVPWRIGRWNVVAVAVRSVLRAGDVRVTGLAAEMSYYALISLVPIVTALGASMGFLQRLFGEEQVDEVREAIVDALTTVFAQQVTSDIIAPLVDGLLDEGRGTVAVGALLVTLYLASRVFRAAVRALDDAYRVDARRNIVAQYLLGLAFTIGALVMLLAVALLVVVGPLIGGGEALAEAFGLGETFHTLWDVLRWPVAFAIGVLFLVLLYRYAPNVDSHWLRCVPGAVVGALGVLLVSSGFTLYVQVFAPSALAEDAGSGVVVRAAAQMLSLVLAGVLWLWLVSIAILLGGILNAELDDERGATAAGAGVPDRSERLERVGESTG